MARTSDLEAAFGDLVRALATADLDAFYGAILPDALILDEDLPFRVDRAGFQAHIAFHGPDKWDGFAWVPYDTRVRASGGTGSVTGFAMFRGKPKDAGYRLRPMMFTQGWTRTTQGWRIASWHQGPLIGHVHRPSPA